MNTEQAIHRLRAVIRKQYKALATESSYVSWLRRYRDAVRGFPDTLTSEQKLERILTDLSLKRDVSASSQKQAFNAVLFFCKDVPGRLLLGVGALTRKISTGEGLVFPAGECQPAGPLLPVLRYRPGTSSNHATPSAGVTRAR
ncbi:MAG: phage integrase N-terminal SAM-like domain-containing protein [Verrucomicrobia bacterium]|nr:phage integrase N-terminal SAM-like domain-containing protein [Verrucomicrobiota bacterium]